jgi:hypothetical protein
VACYSFDVAAMKRLVLIFGGVGGLLIAAR